MCHNSKSTTPPTGHPILPIPKYRQAEKHYTQQHNQQWQYKPDPAHMDVRLKLKHRAFSFLPRKHAYSIRKSACDIKHNVRNLGSVVPSRVKDTLSHVRGEIYQTT
jgi:hypothetical protein